MASRTAKVLIFCLLSVALLTGRVWGQNLNGTISGDVTDQTGAGVPNAELTLTAVATGVTTKATSRQDGLYTFPNLQRGEYELKVAAKGFRDFLQRGITVNLNEAVRVPVSLQLGTSVQTVEVTASASPLNFENAEVKGAIRPAEIAALPLLMQGGQRSAAVFVTLLPGVNMGPSGSTDTQGLLIARINGGAQFSDEATLDGVSMVEGLLNQTGLVSIHGDFPISPEAVGEISVLTSNFDVQYGSSAGAITTAVTKAGTSEFHGGGYEYLRNTSFNARPFGVADRPKDIENDFGGFIGGPFKAPLFWSGRKKTYFFVNFEGYRSRGSTTKPVLSVPTVKMRVGDFSEWPNPIYDPDTTCGQGTNAPCAKDAQGNDIITRQQFMGCNGTTPNVICASDPRLAGSLAQEWLKFVPEPNRPGLTANYEAPIGLANSLYASTDQWDVRADQYIGEKDHVMVTWHYRGSLPFTQHVFPAVIDSNGTRIPNYSEIVRLNYDHTFSPTLLNHFAGGYLDLYTQQYNASDCCVDQLPKIAGVYNHRTTPVMQFSEYSQYGGNGDFYSTRPSWVFNDTLTWVHGKHTLHMGGEYRNIAYPTFSLANGSGTFFFSDRNTGLLGTTSGNSMASFLLGEVDNASASFYSLGSFRPQADSLGVFIGDSWKVTPKLSVNLGLRWDMFRPSVEAKDQTSFFDPLGKNSGAGDRPGRLAFAGNNWADASYGDRHSEKTFHRGFAPRVSFAYSLTPKTVARAGYGIFFSQNFYPGWNGGIATDGFNLTQGFSSSLGGLQPAFLLQNGFPQNFTRPPFIDSTYLNGKGAPNYRPLDANQLPYSQQWNLSVEHQFTENFYVDVAYVGNRGTRLLSAMAPLNALGPKYLAMGDRLYDTFAPGQATLGGVSVPYPEWAAQMTGCSPTVAQALLAYPQYCGNIYGTNENVGDSTYHSLQIKAEKRFSHAVYMLTSYTFSKNLTTSDSDQNTATTWNSLSGSISPFERNRNRSLALTDIPQILAVSLVYDLPFGNGKRYLSKGGAADKVVSGWRATSVIRAQSGAPFFFRSGNCNVPGQFAARCIPAILTGANPLAQDMSNFDPSKPLFNQAAFEPANDFNFYWGAGPRISNLRGFGYRNMDFGLAKDTPLTEKVILQFRIEAFNIWNWHVYSVPGGGAWFNTQPFNTDVASPSFGAWLGGVTAPRNLQVGAKITF